MTNPEKLRDEILNLPVRCPFRSTSDNERAYRNAFADGLRAAAELVSASLSSPAPAGLTKEQISKLSIAGVVIGNLPELPGYNGSILTIDDEEADRIAKDINEVVGALTAQTPPREHCRALVDSARQGGSSL